MLATMKLFFSLGIFTFSQTLYAQKDSLWTIDEISNVTVLISQKTTDTSNTSGTATIISHGDRYFLLTANHVAKDMKIDAQIIFRKKGNKPFQLDLLRLSNHSKPWIHHPVADISLLELQPSNLDLKQQIKEWSFPSYLIYDGKEMVSREADLTFLGYPNVFITYEYFSPLTFNSHLASGLITNYRSNTKIACTFYYLDTPSMQGCSGSGVYYSLKKDIYFGGSKTAMVGVVHGTARDNTGGKLAAITPSFYIWDILK